MKRLLLLIFSAAMLFAAGCEKENTETEMQTDMNIDEPNRAVVLKKWMLPLIHIF
jgi:hypothetical protein